jgi:RNA polymerase sigma-70 factor, ECF subfamily
MLTFQELHEAHAAAVFRFTLSLTRDRHQAEDITSETFVRAWARNDRIHTETLRGYLFTIARNLFLDGRRSSRRQATLDETLADPAPGPAERAVAGVALERVDRLLRTLPETDRSAFLLRVQQDLPYAEVARVLGISLVAARVKVHRVRVRLIAACIGKEPS